MTRCTWGKRNYRKLNIFQIVTSPMEGCSVLCGGAAGSRAMPRCAQFCSLQDERGDVVAPTPTCEHQVSNSVNPHSTQGIQRGGSSTPCNTNKTYSTSWTKNIFNRKISTELTLDSSEVAMSVKMGGRRWLNWWWMTWCYKLSWISVGTEPRVFCTRVQ